jgi:hypothetical protein
VERMNATTTADIIYITKQILMFEIWNSTGSRSTNKDKNDNLCMLKSKIIVHQRCDDETKLTSGKKEITCLSQ